MQQIQITVAGWVATDPRLITAPSGSAVCSFRLASTPQRFDQAEGRFVDLQTEWFTVRAFRATATSVHASIRKGEPVIVTGNLRTHEWNSEEGARTDLMLDVAHIGHDLTKGIATFQRSAIGSPADSEPADADAEPTAA